MRSWSRLDCGPDGSNVLDTIFRFQPGRNYQDLRVVFSDLVASIVGSTTGGLEGISGGRMVVAFPEEEALWRTRRHLKFGHVGDGGEFSIPNVRPRTTYVVAACRWRCDTGYDGENLNALAGSASRVYVDRPGVFTVKLRGH